ncbi:hypothetical protein B0H14DRAFT_3457544 [Mycena olivaceomarginata]|nr:hypothetical protein B0H14DRAFT_3457544 [Mycena olivaceomarginata]
MSSLCLIFSTYLLGASAVSAGAPSNPHLVAYPSILNVLPEPFDRPTFLTNLFYQTTLPDDAPPQYAAAYEQLHNASFISFDPRFATDVIGSAGPVERVAVVEDGSQEMPMYLKDEGVIFWSGNDFHQFRTINVKTYEVLNYTTSVPIPNAAAGTVHKGQMYLRNFGDTDVHGGLWLLDYKTKNATMILNNQLGLSIGLDDMTADDRGGLFFTDTSSRVARTNRTMQSPAALYYLRLSTMSLIAVDPTLVGPNVFVNSAGARTIYAYALSPTTGLPISRRTVAVAEAGFLDGMKVSSSGLIFAAVYGGVDVYHPDGTRLGRINIPEASPNGKAEEKHVVNIVFEGNNLWCFAYGGVYRVQGLLVKGDPRLTS